MSAAQVQHIELTLNFAGTSREALETVEDVRRSDEEVPASAVEAIPDGGYGWIVVLSCSTVTFMINGWSGSWGVLQT